MLKLLQGLIITICLTNNSLAEEVLFYENPSYERVQEIINSYANKDSSISDGENLAKHLTVIFYFYPELIKNIEQDVQNYSSLIQKSIAQAIVNTNGWNEKLPPEYKNLEQNKLNMNINFMIYSDQENGNINLMFTEFFIQSFYISGDTKYIEKILKFISNFPKDVKNAVHKIIYENASQKEIDNLYSAMNEHHAKLTTQLKGIIDFLDKKRAMNQQVDMVVKNIISTNKSFEYR